MEEETYEVTGDVQAQKNAIYEQWLDGAYERIGATAKVRKIAVPFRRLKTQFYKGISRFLLGKRPG